MPSLTTQSRAAGAIMGALIGDALGLGCHWYYDFDEMRRNHGEWISDYTTPLLDRYHAGLKAGQLSQSGVITVMLLRSIAEHGDYREDDFTQRLENELFAKIDGSAQGGPGGYTNLSMREAYQQRVVQKKPWSEVGSLADTTEAAERCIALSARYAKNPGKATRAAFSNCRLTQIDEAIVGLSTAFNCVLALLISGEKLDSNLLPTILKLSDAGLIPFENPVIPPPPGDLLLPTNGYFSSPDPLLLASFGVMAAADPGIKIEPAWKASIVYGLPCPAFHQLPAAYYLAARFPEDYESAVLHAINGGGQNMSRAFLTGALVGAQVGLEGIPARFIEKLEHGTDLVALAQKIGALAEAEPSTFSAPAAS